MKKTKNLVIIPARGGAKRLPGKNLLQLGAIPLIAHSINYALANVDIVDKILVSTDAPDIKKVALSHGAEVLDRPEEYSGDQSPTWQAVLHAIQETGGSWDNIIILQPTNPLRPKALLKEAYEKFIESGRKCLFTVSKSDRKLGKVINESYVPLNYEFGDRSQDLEPQYYENGLLYIVKPQLVVEENCLINEDNIVYEVKHPYGGVDIDSREDLYFARFLLNLENGS